MLNLVIHTRSFGETLLYDFAALLIVLLAAYLYAARRGKEGDIEAEPKTINLLNTLVVVLATLLPVLGVLYLDSIARPLAYFVLQGVLAGIVVALYGKGLLKRYVLAYYLVLAIASIPVLVYYHNYLYPRYDVTKEPLYETGTIAKYMEESARGGFYYYIPVEALDNVEAAYSIGVWASALLPIVRDVIIYLVIILASISLAKRTGMPVLALTPLIYLTSPNLAFWYRVFAFPYAVTLLYLAYLASREKPLETTILATIVATTMVFAHPTGPLAMMLLLAVLAITTYMAQAPEPLQRSIRNTLAILTTIALAYWFTTYIYTLLVPKASRTTNALIDFINTLLGRKQAQQLILGETISPYTAPGYSNPRFYTYAYNWATPVAIAALAAIVGLWRLLRRRLGVEQALSLSAALTATTYIAVAYIGYALNIEPGQYMIPTGYFAAILAATILARYYRARPSLAIAAILLATAIGLGTYSPSWAPLEHPDFRVSVKIHPYICYMESNLIRNILIEQKVYSVYDFLIGIPGKTPYVVIDRLVTGKQLNVNARMFGLTHQLLQQVINENNVNIIYISNLHALILLR